jgi:uncharacterized protein Smg (DUF494 family)
MKESLFEMLLTLFETTILRLKEASTTDSSLAVAVENKINKALKQERNGEDVYHLMVLKDAQPKANRVFTLEEQMKLTKSSHQFMVRMLSLGIISQQLLELVIHRLLLSDSDVVSLQETKWTIRSLLADKLSTVQLAYLDLVLYDKEDGIVLH